MANVFDVAAAILQQTGPISAWKLQKLVYYCQAWHATWRDSPLFASPIQAWANGPVCPDLYACHKGQFMVAHIDRGHPESLTDLEKIDVESVVNFYSGYSGQQLSDITHAERPWMLARSGLSHNDRGNVEITLESMTEYYASLLPR